MTLQTIEVPVIAQTAAPQAPTVAGDAATVSLPVIARVATVRRGPRVRRT